MRVEVQLGQGGDEDPEPFPLREARQERGIEAVDSLDEDDLVLLEADRRPGLPLAGLEAVAREGDLPPGEERVERLLKERDVERFQRVEVDRPLGRGELGTGAEVVVHLDRVGVDPGGEELDREAPREGRLPGGGRAGDEREAPPLRTSRGDQAGDLSDPLLVQGFRDEDHLLDPTA